MKSPFKFLDSYTKDDRDIFFGREREIEELYHRVFESKIMLVYGVSGTGKSSLIHCGLANKFSETDWLPLVIRRGGNILESLAASIKSAAITNQPGEVVTPAQFRKVTRSLYLDHYKPIFFIFDQFEELFIFGSKEEKKAAVQVFKTLVESDIQCRLIFVMREEYMAGITEFEKYIPSIFQNRVRIEKMSHINAIEAIGGPCRVAGITLEDGFAEALLEKLSPESGDVELTYLQVFLDRILRTADIKEEKVFFTNSLLSQVGNVSDLLGSFLDEQISLLSDPDTGLAVLKSFVSIKGTRRNLGLEEVSDYSRSLGKPISESVLQEMIRVFINLRILRDKDQNGKYELRHDALATKIFEKITLVEKDILEIRQLIENAYGNWLRRGVLLSADDLNYIIPYASKLYLPNQLSDFIEKSKNHISRYKRRRRNILIGSSLLLLMVLSGFTIWALKEKRNADKASSRQLESILKLNENFIKIRKNQEEKKNEIYRLFKEQYETKPFELKRLWEAASTIKIVSRDLTDFIYNLEYEMVSKSDTVNIDSLRNFNLKIISGVYNTEIPHNILFAIYGNEDSSNVLQLKKRIIDFKNAIFNQIDEKDRDKIKFSIELEKPIINYKGEEIQWENANFNNTNLAGAITNLNSLVNEINYIEIDAISMLYNWIGLQSFSFNVIRPNITPFSNYVYTGGNYEAELNLSAYDSRLNYEVYIFENKKIINESQRPDISKLTPLISKNGKVNIKIPAKAPGNKVFSGFLSLKKADGGSNDFYFAREFQVGIPPIVITPVAMNNLYRGVNNPIDVSIPGISLDDIKLSATNGTIKGESQRGYTFIPGNESVSSITAKASINGNLLTFPPFEFRIKDIPDPMVFIGKTTEDSISVEEILKNPFLNVVQRNFDLNVGYKILSFIIMFIDSDGKLKECETKGADFSVIQKEFASKLLPGQYLFIKDIFIRENDSRTRKLNGKIYKIIK